MQKWRVWLGCCVFFLSTNVFAGPLTSAMEAYRVQVDKDGKEIIARTDSVKPGDVIEYRMFYTNEGEKRLKGLVISGPIPNSTFFISGSNQTEITANFLVSIDGGETYESEPVTRTKVNLKGEKVKVVIPPSKYTHVRWIPKQALDPAQSQLYTYRVKVK